MKQKLDVHSIFFPLKTREIYEQHKEGCAIVHSTFFRLKPGKYINKTNKSHDTRKILWNPMPCTCILEYDIISDHFCTNTLLRPYHVNLHSQVLDRCMYHMSLFWHGQSCSMKLPIHENMMNS